LNGGGGAQCFNAGMQTFAPLFISHGSPMTALQPREAGAFWQRLGRQLSQAQAVLIASAHSLTHEPVLLAAPQHQAVYDFGGFDPRLNTLRYDAPGAPQLAERVRALLQAAQLPGHVVAEGGLDHGIWVPLRQLLPRADVPVLPLAWPPQWTPAQLFALGQALAPLTEEGVLVIGSGSITHNLRRVFAAGLHTHDQPASPESTAFRDWFVQRGAAADWQALFNYRNQAPHAELMHPSDEHLLPFFIAAGAAGEHAVGQRIHASHTHGELGMDVYTFAPATQA
jgi:4,5-DOPA dioxygenase extradiol